MHAHFMNVLWIIIGMLPMLLAKRVAKVYYGPVQWRTTFMATQVDKIHYVYVDKRENLEIGVFIEAIITVGVVLILWLVRPQNAWLIQLLGAVMISSLISMAYLLTVEMLESVKVPAFLMFVIYGIGMGYWLITIP